MKTLIITIWLLFAVNLNSYASFWYKDLEFIAIENFSALHSYGAATKIIGNAGRQHPSKR